MFKAALFDLDGTLVDSEPEYTKFWTGFKDQYLPGVPDFVAKIKGTTLVSVFERFISTPALQALTVRAIDDFESQMEFPFVAGALEFVRDVKAHGVKCAVVTSSNLKKMRNVWRKVPELMTLMDAVLTAEDFAASKPDPDCYLKAAAALGEPLEDCIVFEDAINGLQAGMASGIYTVGLATENPPEKIRPLCHLVLNDYQHVSYDYFAEIPVMTLKHY